MILNDLLDECIALGRNYRETTMTYTGTLTYTYDDPALVLTATLDDGTLMHVLYDEDRFTVPHALAWRS